MILRTQDRFKSIWPAVYAEGVRYLSPGNTLRSKAPEP